MKVKEGIILMLKRLRTYLHKVYPLIHPHQKMFWLLAMISIIMEPLTRVSAAYFIRGLFDAVAKGDIESVYAWAIAWGVFIITIMAVMFGRWYLSSKFNLLSVNSLRKKILDHILSSKKGELDKYHSGDLSARLNNDASHALGLLTGVMIKLLVDILTFAFMFVYILFINPILVVIPFLSLPLASFISKYFGPKIHQLHKHIQERWSTINIKLQDMLRGMQVIKVYGLNDKFHNEHMENRNFIIGKELANVKLNFFLELGTGGSSTIAQILSLLLVGYLYINNVLTFGDVMLVVFGIELIIYPLQQIPKRLANMESHIASIDRVFEILDIKEEDLLTGDTKTADSSCSIEFKNVEFSYNAGEPVLKDVSFYIKPGEKHAFVGLTGAGKSTIARLLLQFYQPDRGEILFDSRKLNIETMRKLISYVPQEPYLFTGTIKENIGYGNVQAPFESIVEAAKAADAHDFVSTLSEGYESDIGEEGTNLSGGQRQRIAIARALLKNAPIFIWDEATASLDTISESRVQQMIDSIEDKTVVIIAHRLSTVKNADVIHVMHEGRIVESGDHNSLIEVKGRYFELYYSAVGEA
jgi:ABC-type multidrug transport system fused ATPase/permease subunit